MKKKNKKLSREDKKMLSTCLKFTKNSDHPMAEMLTNIFKKHLSNDNNCS